MNYNGKMNLLRFKNAFVISVKGRNETKKGVFIPIDDNNLFVSVDENLKARGAYLDFTAWENEQPGKYGDTHAIRQSLPKDVRDRMTEEERKTIPYFGNMKPMEARNNAAAVKAEEISAVDNVDDLPF